MSKYFNAPVRWQTVGEHDGLGRKRKTHCKHGHKFPDNARWATNWKGYSCRVCPECDRLRMQRKRADPERKAKDAASTARWREQNPDRALATARASYFKRDVWLRSFKTECKFCGESRYPCLDFHHRDSGAKVATIALVRHWSRARLMAEIEKCDIVCSNCHRWHHWKENQERREQKKQDGRISEKNQNLQPSPR